VEIRGLSKSFVAGTGNYLLDSKQLQRKLKFLIQCPFRPPAIMVKQCTT